MGYKLEVSPLLFSCISWVQVSSKQEIASLEFEQQRQHVVYELDLVRGPAAWEYTESPLLKAFRLGVS